MTQIQPGFCHCGCGGRTSIVKNTVVSRGIRRGEHYRFIKNHHRRKPVTPTSNDPVELAWAAGLFEGEGSFCMPTKARTPVASIVSTDEDVIRKFKSIVGVGNIIGPYTYNDGYKPRWQWKCHGWERCQVIVDAFWEHLGERRQQQIIDTYESRQA